MNNLSEHGKYLLLGSFALILGVSSVVLFFGHGLIGLNFSLFALIAVLFGMLLAHMFSRPLSFSQHALIVSGLFFSSMVFIRSSELLTFCNFMGSIMLFLAAVVTFSGKDIRSFVLTDYIKVPFTPFQFITPFFDTFSEIVSIKKMTGDSRTKEIVRGSIMAVIALLIFAGLLSSADADFGKLLANIFPSEWSDELIGRLIMGTIVTAFFVGAFSYMFKKIHPTPAPEAGESARSLGMIETTILLGSIGVLFFAFIILQISHLFGGASEIALQDITYANYAREGFVQLIAVGMLSFLIILFAERQIIQHNGSHTSRFKLLSSVLVLEVIAILISAFTRLSLYENAYGFTDVRLYSHVFMMWIAVALVLLSLHIWKSERQSTFFFRLLCTVTLFLFAMNILNPDVFIAKKNIERYHATGKIDAEYLGVLTYDALPYTIDLLNDPKEEVRKSFAKGLYKKYRCDLDECPKKDRGWQASRLGQLPAEVVIMERAGEIRGEVVAIHP